MTVVSKHSHPLAKKSESDLVGGKVFGSRDSIPQGRSSDLSLCSKFAQAVLRAIIPPANMPDVLTGSIALPGEDASVGDFQYLT
jgi:hypothetical protein